MVTQLQDVSNTVAQEKISNQRLRNEEIRRQMANPWSEPKEPTQPSTSGRQPLQDVTKGTHTLASTYAGLLSNYQGMTGTSSNSGRTEGGYNQNTTGQTSSGNTTFGSPGITGSIPGWAPTVVGTGLGLAGAGIAAPLGAAATQLMSGNRAGAASTLGSLFTNVATKGSIPGLGGVVGALASGLIGDKSKEKIGQDVFNSLLGTGLSSLNPLLGIVYQGLGMLGFNAGRGLSSLFDKTDYTYEGGHGGGFFTKPSDYTGYTPGQSYEPGTKNLSYGGYSPTMNYGSNSGNYWSGSSGSSSGYSGSASSSSYSNPASSYGSW